MSTRVVMLLAIAFCIDIWHGLLGVGREIILVPILVGYLLLPQHSAHATSLVVLPMAIGGSIMYRQHQRLDYRMAASLAVGPMFGSLIIANFVQQTTNAVLLKL